MACERSINAGWLQLTYCLSYRFSVVLAILHPLPIDHEHPLVLEVLDLLTLHDQDEDVLQQWAALGKESTISRLTVRSLPMCHLTTVGRKENWQVNYSPNSLSLARFLMSLKWLPTGFPKFPKVSQGQPRSTKQSISSDLWGFLWFSLILSPEIAGEPGMNSFACLLDLWCCNRQPQSQNHGVGDQCEPNTQEWEAWEALEEEKSWRNVKTHPPLLAARRRMRWSAEIQKKEGGNSGAICNRLLKGKLTG